MLKIIKRNGTEVPFDREKIILAISKAYVGDEMPWYAEHIADALKEQGDERGERIIRSRINGTYKNNPKAIILDNGRENA